MLCIGLRITLRWSLRVDYEVNDVASCQTRILYSPCLSNPRSQRQTCWKISSCRSSIFHSALFMSTCSLVFLIQHCHTEFRNSVQPRHNSASLTCITSIAQHVYKARITWSLSWFGRRLCFCGSFFRILILDLDGLLETIGVLFSSSSLIRVRWANQSCVPEVLDDACETKFVRFDAPVTARLVLLSTINKPSPNDVYACLWNIGSIRKVVMNRIQPCLSPVASSQSRFLKPIWAAKQEQNLGRG